MGGCDYILDIKHSGYSGFVVGLIGTFGVIFNLVLTCIFIIWKFPRLTVKQTSLLMSKTRKALFIVFIISLIPFDFFALHAWRFLPDDAACLPKADWVMVWICVSGLNSVNLLIAALHRPYSLIMVYINSLSYILCVYYYVFATIADNILCGSLFVSVPTLVIGTISAYMIPEYLTLEFEKNSTHTTLYDESLERLGTVMQGPSGEDTSQSAHFNPDIITRGFDKENRRTYSMQESMDTPGTPRMYEWRQVLRDKRGNKKWSKEIEMREMNEGSSAASLGSQDDEEETTFFSEQEGYITT